MLQVPENITTTTNNNHSVNTSAAAIDCNSSNLVEKFATAPCQYDGDDVSNGSLVTVKSGSLSCYHHHGQHKDCLSATSSDTDDSARAGSPSPSILHQHAACTATLGASCTRVLWANYPGLTVVDTVRSALIGNVSVPRLLTDAMLDVQTRASIRTGHHCQDAVPSMVSTTTSASSVLEDSDHIDGAEEAFFVADLGQLVRRHVIWQRALPRIEPFYAMKCNPNPVILSVLAKLGTNFDCASRAEIEAVLALGVAPDRIIYANPCKSLSHLRYARDHGVRMVTFDNADELYKIRRAHPQAQCVLRILTDDSHSVCQLGLKFGAPLHTTRSLIELARELQLQLIGVSFHVGSGCRDAETFADAVRRSRRVFDEAREFGYQLQLLDVGGGFPGVDPSSSSAEGNAITFARVAAVLARAIDEHFPAHEGVRIIAEPGRFYAASAFTLAVNVTARREQQQQNAASARTVPTAPIMYYLNDGVYGSFNCLVFDHAVCQPRLLVKAGQFRSVGQECTGSSLASYEPERDGPLYESSLWGPTCDSIDCIARSVQLPRLSVGDWLAFDNMGAYTLCAASNFNGFCKSAIMYVNSLGLQRQPDSSLVVEREALHLWQKHCL